MNHYIWPITGLGTLAWVRWRFQRWQAARRSILAAGSQVAQTVHGPIEYQLRGKKGPVLLVLHGAPGGYDQGLLVAPHLVGAGFSVLSVSRPGYLRTPLSTAPTPEATADAIIALLEMLEIDQVGVIGLSGGGPFALQVALRHPERVWALEMVCAISLPYDPQKALKTGLVKEIYLNPLLQGLAFWLFDWLIHIWPRSVTPFIMQQIVKHDDPAYVQTLTQQVLNNPAQVRWLQQNIRASTPYSLRKTGYQHELAMFQKLPAYPLHQINVPTLVVHSRYDGDVSFAHARHTAERIPGAELFAVEGAGHLLWLGDEGERVRAKEVEFFQQHAQKTTGTYNQARNLRQEAYARRIHADPSKRPLEQLDKSQ